MCPKTILIIPVDYSDKDAHRLFKQFYSAHDVHLAGECNGVLVPVRGNRVLVMITPELKESRSYTQNTNPNPNQDKINVSQVWGIMQTVTRNTETTAIVLVIRNRVTREAKKWFKLVSDSFPEESRANISVVFFVSGQDSRTKDEIIADVKAKLENPELNIYVLSPSRIYDADLMRALVLNLTKGPRISFNIKVPDICYTGQEEVGPIQEKLLGGWVSFTKNSIGIGCTGQIWEDYQNVYRIRWDGTKDFKREKFIGIRPM